MSKDNKDKGKSVLGWGWDSTNSVWVRVAVNSTGQLKAK